MEQAALWLLFALRALGFIFIVPLFSARSAPPQFRVMLVFFLTMLSFTAWSPLCTPPGTALQDFVPAAISELILGLMLGFIVGLIFVTFQFAGQFIGYQMGFAIVNVLDPQSQTQVSLIGEFLFAVVLLAFLNLNLHHDFIALWHQSFNIAPPGAWALENFSLAGLLGACDDLVYLAFKVALPLLAFLMLSDLSLGIVARVMPQMNVFIVGIPLKIAMGLFFLSFVVLQFDPVVRQITLRFVNDAGRLLYDLAG